MAVIAALLAPPSIQQTSTTGLTPALSAGAASFGTGSSNTKTSGFLTGAVSVVGVSPAGAAISAQKNDEFGGQLFNKIIVIPASKALGYVISAKVFGAEVWSTFKNAPQSLTSITVLGDNGTSITDPYGVPKIYWPQQSFSYTVTVKNNGSGNINASVEWVFGALAGSMTITGTRVYVFAPAPNWENGVRETYGYLTDVFMAYNDNEQRMQLRAVPVRGLGFDVLADTPKRTSRLQSVLYNWQAKLIGVPWWPEVSILGANSSVGDQTITVPTTGKDFVVGGLAVLWDDSDNWEAAQIQSVTSGSITFTLPLQAARTGGKTLVIPLRVSRMKNSLQLSHPANFAATISVDFQVEIDQ